MGVQQLHELMRYCSPFMYCVFHHISGHLPRQILFWKISTKTWASDPPPPPCWAKCPSFSENNFFWLGQQIIRNLGVEESHELIRYCPHLCIVCFFTFLAIYQGKFGFGKFQQKLGLRSDPPSPLLGQKPKFFRKTILTAPLNTFLRRT